MTENALPLQVTGLRKTFSSKVATVHAIDDVAFEIAEGELYTLLGPSGCGKTSTLRSVAGLEHPDDGEISIAGRTVCKGRLSVPPEKRGLGMVFQNYGIWPHMSVFDNAAFPLQVQRGRLGKKEIAERVEEALAAVHLEGFAGRASNQMSGGQQQRLALARALVGRPKLLLLDEPLSNLDAKLREAMRTEVVKLQRELGIATLFVTHDQDEALSMSTRVAVMNAGRIVQEAKPREIYQDPADRFVAEFVGRTNFLDGTVRGDGVETAVGTFWTSTPGHAAGDAVSISVRPEAIAVTAQRPTDSTPNVVEGTLVRSMFIGDRLECHVRAGEHRWLVRVDPYFAPRVDQTVWLQLPPDRIIVIPA
ncbi:ABC transporter ATP-binding protein [Microbacterium sp. 22242]|uniref:ABC transporter ATP-binding protein n=1 Tax=Microbacterium sp. 22242 TaxID=3453896 RepID=UPI003F86A75D